MNTSEYKRFLHICSKNVDNSAFELFNPISLVHSTFDDIDKLKNQASKIRQKFLDNIVDNLLSLGNNIDDYPGGIVLPFDKPYRWTSADVVRKVKFIAQIGRAHV